MHRSLPQLLRATRPRPRLVEPSGLSPRLQKRSLARRSAQARHSNPTNFSRLLPPQSNQNRKTTHWPTQITILSTLSVAIDCPNLTEELPSIITPANAVFDSVAILLTAIRFHTFPRHDGQLPYPERGCRNTGRKDCTNVRRGWKVSRWIRAGRLTSVTVPSPIV